jgi:hypothetical protein
MRAEVQSVIADVLASRSVVDQDGFAVRAALTLESLEQWDVTNIQRALVKVKTDLYRRNPKWKRKDLVEVIAQRLLKQWHDRPFQSEEDSPSERIRILFIGANPIVEKRPGLVETPLALDEEIRQIRTKLRGSEYRDLFDMQMTMATRPDDVLQSLNEIRPHIVHFSGHGTTSDELVLLNAFGAPHPVSKDALETLFKTMKDSIRVVVLNACFSRSQARAITKHIDCAIGMNKDVGDAAAIIFSAAFYRGLGFGHSIKRAFDEGILALKMENNPDYSIPELICRKGVKPNDVRLI